MAADVDESDADWPIRSLLYVPATRPEWVEKAVKAGPDAVILDLEDAVGPGEKSAAAQRVPAEVAALRASGVAAFVRPNSLDVGGVEDLLSSVCTGLGGIVLPKADVNHVRQAHDVLSYAEGRAGLKHGSLSIIALPETAAAIREAYDVAKASRRVRGLLGGVGVLEGDVSWSCGYRPTVGGEEQLYVQSKLIIDSRSAGASFPLAAVFTPQINDLAMLEVFAQRARHLGFTGAAVIHPSHVATVNSTFCPTTAEVEHYKGLIDALEGAHRRGDGAVMYEGAMVDAAMLPIARHTVALAQRRKPLRS